MDDVTGVASRASALAVERPIRPCPVCGSGIHDVLYEQRFEDFAAGSITDAYDVVACRSCGMCFASGLPEHGRFAEYYGQSSKYDMGAAGAEVSRFDAQRYRDEAAFIAAHVADRSRSVLDIGTATGDLLVALRDLGFTNLHGVEPSAEAARKARELHGLDVIPGDIRTAKELAEEFDLVSLVAVLEHLVDPASALREVAALLSTTGILYLLVPDATSFSEHVNAPYQEFSVEHINYFTSASLSNLLAMVGLHVSVQQRTVLEQSEDSEGGALEVLCQRSTAPAEIQFDAAGLHALRAYVDLSARKEAGVVAKINELAESQSPIFVWGTGTNTLHLLIASRLAECNIVAFLDSNPHYAGRELAGRPVMIPTAVANPDAPILVASAISQTAIATAARTLFGQDVPLILLY